MLFFFGGSVLSSSVCCFSCVFIFYVKKRVGCSVCRFCWVVCWGVVCCWVFL